MKIDKLKNLEANLTIGRHVCEGMTEEEIDQAERTLEIHFPKTYREYIFLAGESTGPYFMYAESSFSYLSQDKLLKTLGRQLKEYDVLLDRPIWAFLELDGYEQFLFFYLDENDDDPEIWRAEFTDVTEIKKLGWTFSQYIDLVVKETIIYSKDHPDYL